METKVTADSEMIKVEYAFGQKELEEILEKNTLEPVIEAGVIVSLIQDNEEEWRKLPLKNKLEWIKDELVEWILLDYLARYYVGEFLKRRGMFLEDCILSIDYDGAGVIVTIAIQSKEQPSKQELEDLVKRKSDDKVVYLEDYRRSRPGVV